MPPFHIETAGSIALSGRQEDEPVRVPGSYAIVPFDRWDGEAPISRWPAQLDLGSSH